MKLPIKSLAPLAMRQAPRVYNAARKSDRVNELINLAILGLTAVITYYNAERIRLARINNHQNAESGKITNEILDEIKKINKS